MSPRGATNTESLAVSRNLDKIYESQDLGSDLVWGLGWGLGFKL